MSRKIREDLLPRYVARYWVGRRRMIDEVCEQWGYSRKHSIKLLGAKAGWGGNPARREGRPAGYGADVAEVLWRIWKVAEQPCGKRLAEVRWLLLPHYEARKGKSAVVARARGVRLAERIKNLRQEFGIEPARVSETLIST